MKVTYSKNGNEYAQFRPMGRHPLLIKLLNLDVAIARNIQELEAHCYPDFYRSHGLLGIDEVLPQLGEPCDFLFYPIVAWECTRQAGGVSWQDRPRLLEEVLPAYLDLFCHAESVVEGHAELVESIIRIRSNHRDHCLMALSDLPYTQALRRLENIGLGGLFNGVIGVRREHPQILNDYGREVDYIHDWTERQLAKSDLDRYEVIGGVPVDASSQWTNQARVVEMLASPGESSFIAGLDSKPSRTGAILDSLKKLGYTTGFVHAKNSAFELPTTEKVDASFTAMRQLPEIISSLVAGRPAGRWHKIRV